MKEINILSWGGGTQSTALMLLLLEGKIKDKQGNKMGVDYIVFADTKNEPNFVYDQIWKIMRYVKKRFNKEIIVTSKNKEPIPDEEIVRMIRSGKIKKYRNSPQADLFQSHILYFKGEIDSIDVMPFWVRNKKTGKVGKTPFKTCTHAYKINQIMKEVREQEGLKRFETKKHKLNMYIGYSVDEFLRFKDNPLPYANNVAPLIDMNMTKQDCINYVEKKIGFRPTSSVCNMCYANDFDRVYKIYKEDSKGWNRLLELDDAMANKPESHKIKDADVFMFRWQAEHGLRLKDVNMETFKKDYLPRNIFSLEQEMACAGGCFL